MSYFRTWEFLSSNLDVTESRKLIGFLTLTHFHSLRTDATSCCLLLATVDESTAVGDADELATSSCSRPSSIWGKCTCSDPDDVQPRDEATTKPGDLHLG